jgi:hypothetical protein
MKRSDLLPIALVLPLVGFVALQVMQAHRVTAVTQAATLAADVRTAAGRLDPVRTPEPAIAPAPAPAAAASDAPRDIREIRHRLELGAPGTYISDILLERDSALARWPDRVTKPIRIWIGNGSGLAGWNDDFPGRVRAAFEEWMALGIPVRFTFVADSADADVHVSWIDHFETPISGKTLWARDRNWWIVNGNITLALHHNGGEPLDDSAVKAIALHEVGHLLGLDHTSDTTDIMTARVRVRDLSDADRATMKLLYTLPPGSVK